MEFPSEHGLKPQLDTVNFGMWSQGRGLGCGGWEAWNRELGKVIQGSVIRLVTAVGKWAQPSSGLLCRICFKIVCSRHRNIHFLISVYHWLCPGCIVSSFQLLDLCLCQNGWEGLLQASHRERNRSPREEGKRCLVQLGQGPLKLPLCTNGQTKQVIWEDVGLGTWAI